MVPLQHDQLLAQRDILTGQACDGIELPEQPKTASIDRGPSYLSVITSSIVATNTNNRETQQPSASIRTNDVVDKVISRLR